MLMIRRRNMNIILKKNSKMFNKSNIIKNSDLFIYRTIVLLTRTISADIICSS